MDFNNIKHIVYTPDVRETNFIKSARQNGVNCIQILDARSAVYTATGISAQNKEMTIVCLSAGNSSRSAFSGMTEAFYRRLPIVLITFGMELDYSQELADVIYGHYIVSSEDQIKQYLDKQLPVHIEVQTSSQPLNKKDCLRIQEILTQVLNEESYFYIGQGVRKHPLTFNCKVVEGGMPNCYEGAVANVLGASLAKNHSRYIGLITEDEFVHDMNTLGNININDSLLFIVAIDEKNLILENYAKALGYEFIMMDWNKIDNTFIENIVNNKKRTILFISQED